MIDFAEYLRSLHRPKLLISAAAHAASDLRLPALRQSLRRYGLSPNSAEQFLAVEEQSLNDLRAFGDATYSLAKHVVVLAALLRQANLRQTHPSSSPCAAA